MMILGNFASNMAKPIIWICSLYPLGWLVWAAFSDNLGANPIEFTNRYLGETALKILFFSLSITPIRIITGWRSIVRVRRLLGLFAFFYVILHFGFYISIEHFFNWHDIWQDIVKRNYITFGFIAFIVLVPLAITSTKSMIKRVGAAFWKRLHKLVYLSALLATVHFFMMRKGVQLEPIYYLIFLLILYLVRAFDNLRRRA